MDWYHYLKKLSRDLGIKFDELLALSSASDPFHIGTKADIKLAEWAKDIWDWVQANWQKKREELLSMGYDVGEKPHLRGIHYLYLTGYPNPTKPNGKPYLGTYQDWQLLIKAFIRAKILKYIPFGEIEDRKHPKPIIGIQRGYDSFIYWGDGEAEEELTEENITLSISSDLISTLTIGLYGTPRNIEKRFPYHLEFWTEKDSPIINQVASKYYVTVQPSVGEQTYENVYALMKRAKKLSKGRPVRIFYISDYDPRGEFTMPVAVARKIEWLIRNTEEFEGVNVKLKKICLTQEQVGQLKLPPAPVKETEPMKGKWMKQRGTGIVELNSIESLHPTEFIRILEEAVKPYYDEDTIQQIRDYNKKLNETVKEFNSKVREEVNEKISELEEQLREKVEHILEEFGAKLSFDYTEEQEKVKKLVDSWEEPEWNMPDENEDEWLYSSERDYLDQIKHYRRMRS